MRQDYTWADTFEFAAQMHAEPLVDRGGQVLMGCGAAFCFPGLGHLIIGRFLAAFCWAILTFGAAGTTMVLLQNPAHLSAMLTCAAACLALYLIQIIDAGRCARSRATPVFSLPPARYALGVTLAIGALLWQRAAIAALQENFYELCYSPTPSMSPAIGTTDYFLLLKGQPVQRWDIAGIRMPNTIQFPQAEMVKRVVGLPGETVELTPDGLLINGQRVRPPSGIGFYVSVNMLDQPLQSPDARAAGNGCWGRPIKLMSDEYFLLGDNTTESYDSRLWPGVDGRQPGALPAARLSGRVAAIVWPPDRSRLFEQVLVSGSQK